MYKIEANQTIKLIMTIFYRIGVWHNKDETDLRKNARKLFYFLYYILFQVFILTCSFLVDDKSESLFLSELAIIFAVITIKLFYLLWKEKEIVAFIDNPIVAQSTENRVEWEQVNSKMNLFTRFVQAYLWMLFITACFISFSCLPIFYSERTLPFFISFTLRCKYSDIVFSVTYVLVSLAIFCSLTFNLITVLIWYVTLTYSLAYTMLGFRFKSLGVSSCTYHNDLIECIQSHRTLFGSIQQFRSFFSPLFLAHITTSGVSICISTYNLALAYNSAENVVQSVIFIVVLLYGLSDIFMVMLLCNEITSASDQLSINLYNSNWIPQSELCKKCVVILFEALQQPQNLLVLVYPLNLPTFTAILKGAYSMFNILNSF